VCRACLPAEDKLPPFVQSVVEYATKNPDKMQVLMLPRVENITVSLNKANYTLGQQLELRFKAPAKTKTVFFAVERMRKDDKYNPEEPDQFPLYTGVLAKKSIDLSLLGVGEFTKVSFEAKAVAPDMNAGDRLRLYVCDADNEEVFGYTDWVPYYTSPSMPKSKFWLYSGWSDCIQECGPEQQTRDAFCVNEIGDKVDGCVAADKEPVSRECGNPVCTFQAISVIEPAEGATVKGSDSGSIKLNVQANGGLTNLTYDVRVCTDGAGYVECENPQFEHLRCVLVGQARPGERKEFSFSLSQFKLERQKLRLLAARARLYVSVAGEDILSPAFADRRAYSGVFTLTSERRYKLDTPDKVPQPKAWLAVGSAGVSDGKAGDDQSDIGEVLYVWASPEWVNRTDIANTYLIISSPDPLLGGPDVPQEKLKLTFDKATGISTCSPHDGLLMTATAECKAKWANAKEPLACVAPISSEPDVLMPDSAVALSVASGIAVAAAATAL